MRIFVGMSGGVDSSLTAALLKEQGHEVRGVFIKGWYPEGFPCTWQEDRVDAMRVAAQLGIPFSTLDLSAQYKESVIDYLFAEYEAGRTPNPDILCNRDIKFGHFLDWAKAHGAETIATGHYAQSKDGHLYRGIDEGKDQSYFLYTLHSDQLRFVQFPLGSLTKEKTRTQARARSLPVATKRDSQGLCFLGTFDMQAFLSTYIDTEPGVVLDTYGSEIGTHEGAVIYTLGQRHGFTVTTGSEEPLYVLSKDLAANTITVGPAHAQHTNTPTHLHVEKTSWVQAFPEIKDTLTAQYRYHGPKISISDIEKTETGARVTFDEALPETPAAGQSLVVYSGTECIGGGVIVY